jgi:hypothetical protein
LDSGDTRFKSLQRVGCSALSFCVFPQFFLTNAEQFLVIGYNRLPNVVIEWLAIPLWLWEDTVQISSRKPVILSLSWGSSVCTGKIGIIP